MVSSRYEVAASVAPAPLGAPPPPPALAVPPELNGLCLGCLRSDHIRANCRYPVRCYNCGAEGHRAATCPFPKSAVDVGTKRARSPAGVDAGRRVAQRRSSVRRSRYSADTVSGNSVSTGNNNLHVPEACAASPTPGGQPPSPPRNHPSPPRQPLGLDEPAAGGCGGINPYTLMGLYGPHHERWLGPQDEDVRRMTGRRAPQGYKILYQIGYFACNSVPSRYIRRGRGPLEDR